MALHYPYAAIWINSKKVLIRDIVDGNARGSTSFESETFEFIRQWCSDKQTFELQTSGSTGTPKSIRVTRDMMQTSALLTKNALHLQPEWSALVCLNTKFIAGKMMLVRCLEAGMKIFAVDPCANPFIELPVDQTIHFAALVPYQVKSVLESKHPHLFDSLTVCIVGGAPVDANLHNQLQHFSCNVFVTYGMTETVSHVALKQINGHADSQYFKTLPGVSVSIDSRGCLKIHAPYLSDEIVTNDLVELRDETTFRWLGRIDNVINSGGLKISPEILEEKIGQIFTQLHIPNKFFVHSVPDESLHQKVVLVTEGPIENRLRSALEEKFIHTFSPYEKPKLFFESDHFVFTATEKINRIETMKSSRPFRG